MMQICYKDTTKYRISLFIRLFFLYSSSAFCQNVVREGRCGLLSWGGHKGIF